jgi:hypothetical protein
MTMIPSMNPADPPSFHQLAPEVFEELCRDVLEEEGGIASCELYGVRGQSQLGIDIKAQRDDGYSCDVAQCKRTAYLPPRDIRSASDKFLNHLDEWRRRNVQRFILIVASPLHRKGQQDEIDRQIQHFASLGIKYEAWSSRTLRGKLSAHPEIVRRYMRSEEWVRIICGTAAEEEAACNNANGDTGGDRLAMEIELEELTYFKKLFGFEAKKELRRAVLNFYNASKRIGRSGVKDAQEFLSEEDGRLKVNISKFRHAAHSLAGLVALLFFLSAIGAHPVLWSGVGFKLMSLLFVCSMVSLVMHVGTFFVGFNPYVQALRIRRELIRLQGEL